MNINDELIVKIDRLNNEGKGIAIYNKIVIFVDGALPNEEVKIRINKINKNYYEASLIDIIKKSDERADIICPYYNECGGCNLMHINYNAQLNFKKNKIKSIFKKICNEDINISNIYSQNNLNYRNKVVFKVVNNQIGFYKEKTNELIEIDNCFIIDDKINILLKNIKLFINKYQDNKINEIMIRVINNKIMISIDNINNDYKEIFINNFKNINSIYIKNKLEYGEKVLIEKIEDLRFNISPKSFFQVNKQISEMMYKKAISYIDKSDTTLDLYSGTGTITMLLSKKCKKVIGIESVKDAVKDSNNNIKNNNINNVEFICSKVENRIETLKKLNIDNIVLDPPRSGSDKKTLNSILKISPKKIVYISCNPITLARDYNILKQKYIIKEINAYDMFPNTYHIESLLVLEKKDV